MDPVANLREQLELARLITDIWDRCDDSGDVLAKDRDELEQSSMRLAELVLALDEWRKRGGFDPYGSA